MVSGHSRESFATQRKNLHEGHWDQSGSIVVLEADPSKEDIRIEIVPEIVFTRKNPCQCSKRYQSAGQPKDFIVFVC